MRWRPWKRSLPPVVAFPHRGAHRDVAPSGATISLLTLAERLRKRGVRPVVLVHKDEKGAPPRFRPSRGPWGEIAGRWGLECYAVETPWVVKREELTSSLRERILDTADAWKVALDELGVAAVHTNDAHMHRTWSLLCRQLDRPHVWHERGTFGPASEPLLPHATAVATISEFAASFAPSSVEPRVIPSPIEVPTVDRTQARRQLRYELGLAADDVVVGMVANANPRKRWDRFARVAAAAKRRHRSVTVVTVGLTDEQTRADIDRTVDGVRHLGYRDPGFRTIAGLDAVLATADNEPHGRVIVEAIQLGVPVVATRSGGHTEILRNVPEMLFDPNDTDGMAAACTSTRDLEPEVAKLAGLLRRRYSTAAHTQEVLDLYASTGVVG